MYYIGIDIAKNSHEVCFLDTEGNILDGNSFNIRNNGSGFARLEQMLSRYHLSGDNALVGMEATGHYWLVLYSWFLEKGFEVKVINPLVTDGYRHMQVRKAKTDRIDAEIVAKVLRLGEYQETSVLDEDVLGIRQLCRYRLWLVSSCSDLKRKIIALLDQVFPEYSHLFSDVFGMASKELLKAYATPEEMLSVSTRKLSKLLEKTSRGHFGKPKAMEIKTLASQSVGIHLAQDAFAFQIRQMLEQLDFVETQIQDLEQEIQAYMDKLDSPVTSVPGVGPVYGAVILSEIGDIHRFPSEKQLVSYSGIDASVHESGDFQASQTHMSKRGSPYLRRAIWGAAFIASHSDPELTAYYQRLRARGKHHSVAVGAVARKLCYILYSVLSENRPFEVRA
ncbi:TPA: IS110 family transposase [Streptococcus agalactiae]|nr:IS110 family transposase [Streptococcus agalactiae]